MTFITKRPARHSFLDPRSFSEVGREGGDRDTCFCELFSAFREVSAVSNPVESTPTTAPESRDSIFVSPAPRIHQSLPWSANWRRRALPRWSARRGPRMQNHSRTTSSLWGHICSKPKVSSSSSSLRLSESNDLKAPQSLNGLSLSKGRVWRGICVSYSPPPTEICDF